MDNDTFYAARRPFYYDKSKIGSSFYKTVELVFCPQFLRDGFSFGAFLVIDARTGTKSVSFTDFVSFAPHVSLRMLFPWEDEEKRAILASLVDVHPPAPLDVPSATMVDERWAQAERNFRTYLAPLASFRATAASSSSTKRPQIVYYVRASKLCNDDCAQALKRFFLGLEQSKGLRAVEVSEERVTDNVGGYRFVLAF